MSDPKERKDEQAERDDLELQPELVKDLDVSDETAGQLRGGHSTISTRDAMSPQSTVG
jgi:hypothetical protein